MPNKRFAMALFASQAVAAHVHAQTVTDQSFSWLVFAIDSAGEEVVAPNQTLNPTAAPVSVNLLAENFEPLSPLPFPSFHRASVTADLDSTGSRWTGSGLATAHYADALNLSQNVGGNNIPAAAVIFRHSVEFSLGIPTTVNIASDFLIQMTDPFNPLPITNLFDVVLRDGNGTIYSTGFDRTLLGVQQQVNDSIVLAPGSYEFQMDLIINTQEQLGFRDGSIDFSYDLSFVPSPPTAAGIASVALFGMRRRR